MEYCSRGDLLDLINEHIGDQKRGLSEEKARKVFAMLVHGVHHIHNQGIVHRDLKCENILLDKDENVKITENLYCVVPYSSSDFGFSTTFLPGQSALLKTSCGSYAYTAPEVIRVRPYDGTKSDIWSLGIILFAMLNGRLPFNDAQLCELEEEMKMQRIRFERTVNFDSMVFVRRMLQYQPSARPTMTDIIADPWLTGHLAIPRQPNKPRWTNNNDSKKKPKQEAARGGSDASMGVGGTQPIYYKTTDQKRGSASAVSVNHDQKETIVLKSRTGARQKKNIWIRGPLVSQRPKTWPRTDRKPGPQPPPTRTPSAGHRNNTATVVVTKLGCSEHTKRSAVDSGAKNIENIKLSKWFMDKYMAGKEASFKNNPATNCACCKAEAEVVSSRKQSKECVTLENGELIQAAIADSERFSAHVTRRSASGRDKVAKPPSAGARKNRAGPGNDMAGRGTGLVNYMVNPSRSPGERVKYFRDRLLRNYSNDEKAVQKCDGNSGLPHLLVQPLKTTPCPPEPVQDQARKSSPSPTRAVSGRSPTRAANGRFPTSATTDRQTSPTRESPTRASNGRWASANGRSWRQMRGASGKTSPVKPKQRVVVHSSIT
ncbi:TSSK5-like protein [Mya arenaria]|uniref:TSSK5-like protein n=1 Tax=Mya arenaria TaxID=6604 RepID=A0ABY7DUK9_MYAAR|nr:TSSK5-like protein [Mya arenaria]